MTFNCESLHHSIVQSSAQYSPVHSTVQCTVQSSAQYSPVHSTVKCTVQSSAQYSPEHSTVQCTEQSSAHNIQSCLINMCLFCQILTNCLSFFALCHTITIHRTFFLKFYLLEMTINEQYQTVI